MSHGRNGWIALLLIVPSPLGGCGLLAEALAGPSRPSDLVDSGFSPAARELIDRAFEEMDPKRLVDVHVHVAGIGVGGTGCTVNPEMRSGIHPIKRLRFEVYLRAAGVKHLENADREFVLRLVDLARRTPLHGRYRILAMDHRYRHDGSVDEEHTEFHVPNEYVFGLAEEFPDVFLPTISVHPYRADAREELERGARRGATLVKWLPNSQGIDPSDPACDPFYVRMRELGMILLTHAGEEKAVEASKDQRLGNPLLLRRALDHGVRVVVAHCASLGWNEDLDDPRRRKVRNFDLFLRLMDEERYRGLLFGEISATTQANRMDVLRSLLERRDLHARLVNGSDYPLPAVGVLVRLRSLVSAGYLEKEDRRALGEIFEVNPLLFDFVLKRTIHAPGSLARFSPSVFMENGALGPRPR